MHPDSSETGVKRLNLADMVGDACAELQSLLGPSIHLATGTLPAGGRALVNANPSEIVDLLRHVALDALDSMPEGGTMIIRTGCLREAADCAAMVIHEVPDHSVEDEEPAGGRRGKGRSLGLGASYETVRRAGGHFHVSCRGVETVLTICFPPAG